MTKGTGCDTIQKGEKAFFSPRKRVSNSNNRPQKITGGRKKIHSNANKSHSTLRAGIEDLSSFTKVKKRAQKLLQWDEIPAWMRDNTFITRGYRSPTGSYKECIKSLTYLHNEFLNVWTHFIGAIVFMVLMVTTASWVSSEIHTVKWSDVIVMYIFLAGAVGCLLLSTAYHLFSCHSHEVHRFFNRCDYVGIASLITGSCVPVFFYAFYCHDYLKVLYISMIVILGVAVCYLSISPTFSLPEWRIVRAFTFVGMAASGVIPGIHSFLAFGWAHTMQSLQLGYLSKMAAFYTVAVAFYSTRVPERWFPGKFDIWLQSHTIFHCLVLAAAGYHYIGVLKAIHWAHIHAAVCPAI
ncbi:Adiponectin receptor protein [Zancudomyces culisetae]|uniref:Adiponectin receptor protein n=1 Tax=Zancudomyces culisetae TaxID=1213189 RepID=A0A1R1PLR4_ZANCU|nr:Adiponectin receptor protein [Zancudomyces culisetae]|eukprot:OMH81921.1 Adiponectin receptor protein [Zancudomyces culisetae]